MEQSSDLSTLPPLEDPHVVEVIRTLSDNAPRLARKTMQDYAQVNPRHAEFGAPEYLLRESVHTSRIVMQTVLASVISADPGIDQAMGDIASRLMERAEEQLPLREYLRVWTFGFEVVAGAVIDAFEEAATALPILTRMRRTHDLLFRRAAETYVLATGQLNTASSRHDNEVLDALVEGSAPHPDEPNVAGSTFIHMWIDAAPDARSRNTENRIVALNRTARIARAYLVREMPSLLLLDVTDQHGRLVLGTDAPDLNGIVSGMAAALGVHVILATEHVASREDVPLAAATARAALETARNLSIVDRHIRMADVALQHQLSYPSLSLPTLKSQCSALIDDETLRLTVSCYLENGLDRRATADALFVHPNTIDNRLAKIRALTGLNIHKPRDLVTIAVGLAANNSLPA